ncbi:transcription factor GTE9-like isoform X1 [Zingiber officinale]|uniref:transcription factor GTE9-like isoform X1 n=2 Tax=Zingiber officinale TaxID=94328 RepID=UPI001C4B694D|nr:transcription factor GTE9-like isoform X1 [Zingiber officinale]
MMRTVSNRIDCMAPTVLMEYTKEKQRKKCSQDLSFALKEKSHKLSKGCGPLASLPDYQHDSEKMHDSEDVGSFVRAQSDDSSSAKRQKFSVNLDGCEGCNIPLQQIPYLRMSGSQRKKLKMRLRSELNQVQMLQKRFFSRAETVGVITSSSVNETEKEVDPKSVTQLKRVTSGKSELSKMTVPPPPVHSSSLALKKQCEGLLKRLMSHRFAWVFNLPVDVKKLNIPDYYTVIKNPMDLGSIKTKLSSGGYSSLWDFAADVRLTFTNAMTYNPPTNDVHLMADSLSKYFELHWKPIEKKLAAADAYVKKEIQVPKSVMSSHGRKNLSKPEVCSRKRKKSHIDCIGTVSQEVKRQMSKEEKLRLASHLESHLDDLPDHIIDFLRQHSNMNDSCGEIEIDIDSLGDDTLFKLQDLLDKYFQERGMMRQQVKFEQCKMEVSENALSTSVMHQFKDNNPAEEDVDIGGDDPPISNYPTLDIRKDTKSRETKCGSSSSYTSDSGSSTDSDSSNGSELKKFSIPKDDAKENSANKAGSDQEKSDLMNPFDMNRPLSELNCSEKTADAKSSLVDSERFQEGEHAPSEKKLSPEKQYRVALLRNRFADTILKAKEKTLGQGAKGDPEKLQRTREEIKRQQKEDRARLQAEAKAAEEACRRAEAEAAAEAKRQRQLEREAARQALSKIEKTVEINDCQILEDLEMLGTATAEEMPISDNEKNSGYSLDDMGGFKLGGSNPLEQLGLFMKADDEEEEEYENVPLHDAEEGEIE